MSGLAAIVLLFLTALLDAATPALRSRRLPARQPGDSAALSLRRRFATEPRRARHAAWLLRITLLGAIAACVLLAPIEIRMTVALIAVVGLAFLLALTGGSALRRPGIQSEFAAVVMLWPLAPFFLLLPAARSGQPAARRDPDETIADIADALASESAERQLMVEALLDLERRSVEDIMVPRSEIEGIDIAADWDDIVGLLRRTQHTRMPLFEGGLDRVLGIIHMRLVANEIAAGRLTRDRLREIAGQREALFTPEGTTLHAQLLRFRRLRRRIAFIVDEYGDVRGLVTLEDILEEVVGEFTTQPAMPRLDFSARPDGSYVVPGGVTLRSINRAWGLSLPTDGPRTLSGLIVEHLESIPEPGATLQIGGRTIEVLQVADNAVRTARILPAR
ncbi:MAG: CBS domain-containing protein [Gammaproteobacteria bacterium]|nr:CBS domain-containing protein [Gammaproteobacteria bacterium]